MASKNLVFDLYQFLKEGVTSENLHEADKKSYPQSENLYEGKLPEDPSLVKDPMGDIQKLAEKETKDKAENTDIKTDNAGITEDPEKTKLQKELEKESPKEDKLTQDKDGQDPAVSASMKKVADEKKITPEITGVEKVKAENESKEDDENNKIKTPYGEKNWSYIKKLMDEDTAKNNESKEDDENTKIKTPYGEKNWSYLKKLMDEDTAKKKESKLPSDPSLVKDPAGDIIKLAEERAIATVSDEAAAKAIQAKYPGSQIVVAKGSSGKAEGYTIMIKETTTVTVKTEDNQGISVSTTGGEAPTITTSETPGTEVTIEPKEEVVKREEPTEEELENQPELADEEVVESAEKEYVMEFLESKKELNEKEKMFINEIKKKHFSKKNKEKISKKKAELKKGK